MIPNISAIVPTPSSFPRTTDAPRVSAVSATAEGVPQQNATVSQAGASANRSVKNDARNEDITKAVSYLNDYIQSYRRDLQFSVDDDSGRIVVKVIDKETREVIRQIPSEEALQLAKRMEQSNGMLLQAQA
ncbi:MAG: flagellar protein FlaG [Gammaproteobacteria bacterium]|nr:flagellar protein FlaG [Gammaproteobacteria bacterium]